MPYIPYFYDQLVYEIVVGTGALIGVSATLTAVLRGRPKGWLDRMLMGTVGAVAVVLVLYSFYILMRQAHEKSVDVRQNSDQRQRQQFRLKRADDENNVRLTLLQYLFAAQNGDTESKVYFLDIEGTNATADCLQQFKDNVIPVKNVSQARYGQVAVPFDKASHQRGCVFSLSAVRWVNDDKVTVAARVHWGGREGYGGTYPMVRQGSQWVVKQSTENFEN